MSVVRVAIPVYRGKRRFHLDKGRPWSIAEHMLLQAIIDESHTAAELEALSCLPRRLIIEALIRLMRAGWVHLSQGPKGVSFRANEVGKSLAQREELPNAPKRIIRWLSFIVDRLTGAVFHGREMPPIEKHMLERLANHETIVWLAPREGEFREDVDQVVTTLFRDDEKFVSVDPNGDRLVERFVLVTVRDGKVDGLPIGAPDDLRDQVLAAAKHAPARPAGLDSPTVRPSPAVPLSERPLDPPKAISFSPSDLVLGGESHRRHFEQAIKGAHHRIIIHSTFIRSEAVELIDGMLMAAIGRGAQIDILWGEDETKVGGAGTWAVANALREKMRSRGRDTVFRVHTSSTGSHAKIVVADQGKPDNLVAYVGSCNWLYSGFDNYEASVRLRDPLIIADVLGQLAELSRGTYGHWTPLTSDLAAMADRQRRAPRPGSAYAEAALVLGPQHAQYVRKARDEATDRIMILSHRLGAVANAAAVIPAVAAARARSVRGELFFGKLQEQPRGVELGDLVFDARHSGVDIRPIFEPRVHAKVLAWDRNDAVITSQNWLSADPAQGALRQEIGVYLHATNVGRNIREHFESSRTN